MKAHSTDYRPQITLRHHRQPNGFPTLCAEMSGGRPGCPSGIKGLADASQELSRRDRLFDHRLVCLKMAEQALFQARLAVRAPMPGLSAISLGWRLRVTASSRET